MAMQVGRPVPSGRRSSLRYIGLAFSTLPPLSALLRGQLGEALAGIPIVAPFIAVAVRRANPKDLRLKASEAEVTGQADQGGENAPPLRAVNVGNSGVDSLDHGGWVFYRRTCRSAAAPFGSGLEARNR